MFLLENTGESVFCIGDKNLIPGTDPVEVTKEEANHPMVKLYIKAKKLSLTEVADEVEEVEQPVADLGKEKGKK